MKDTFITPVGTWNYFSVSSYSIYHRWWLWFWWVGRVVDKYQWFKVPNRLFQLCKYLKVFTMWYMQWRVEFLTKILIFTKDPSSWEKDVCHVLRETVRFLFISAYCNQHTICSHQLSRIYTRIIFDHIFDTLQLRPRFKPFNLKGSEKNPLILYFLHGYCYM